MTPPVTTEPACSRLKSTDISPYIPQETLILEESVRPPGTVLGGGTKSFSLACSRIAWIAVHVFKPVQVLCVLLTTMQGEGKANAKWYNV